MSKITHCQAAVQSGWPAPTAPRTSRRGITSIKQLAGQDLSYGAFVGVPQHSALLLFPVETAASLDVVPVLDHLVRSMYDASEDPCTAGIYWFVGDDAHLIGVQVRANGQPRVNLPPELRAVVNTLPG